MAADFAVVPNSIGFPKQTGPVPPSSSYATKNKRVLHGVDVIVLFFPECAETFKRFPRATAVG